MFNKKRLTSALATALLVGAQLLSPFSVFVPKVAADDEQQVTICHRTDSVTNPYVQETVAASSVDGDSTNDKGQGDHLKEHTGLVFDASTTYPTPHKGDQWGDIIPSVDINSTSYDNPQTSLNWNTTGQAIWNNGCKIPNGTITLIKNVQNNHGGTAGVNSFGLTIGGTAVTSGQTLTLPAGSYALNEAKVSGYTFVSLTGTGCPTQLGGTVSLVNGQNITCTITNTDVAGQLKVIKNVVKDNGGSAQPSDFTMYVNGNEVAQNQYVSENAGSYTITESGPSGYKQTGITCVDDTTQQAVSYPVSLGLAQSVTCAVTNDDVPPSLTLVKLVNNDHGGTAQPSAWTLSATDTSGAVALSGQTGVTSGSDFKAGTYTLGESNGPAGYTASSWTCTGGVTVTNSQITLTNGQSTTCTITNSDIDPVLTVIKQVINPYGVAADPSYFPLFVDGTSVTSGVPTVQQTGTHIVTETQQFGYIFRDATGDCTTDNNNVISVIIGVGDSKTCTLTNTAIQPKLIVVKHVVNDNGGTKHANDFTMTVSGNSATVQNFAGNEQGTTVYLNEGSYSVDELSHDGYTETLSDDCKGTITIGETKTCIITNDDMPASLKVVKVAYPESSQSFSFTSAKLGDFSLVGDNSTDSSKTFDNLSSGTYVLSEQATDNWQNVYMECRNTDVKNYSISNNNLSITLSNGDNVTCYVYNLELNIISGHKFNDVNDNHVWDSGEPTLKNWTITLTGCLDSQEGEDPLGAITDNQACADQISRTTTTDAAGAYSFSGLEPGTYTVCEVQQANWTQTYPQDNNGCHKITVDVEQYGEVFTADFGNHPKPQVLGSSTTKLLVNTGMDASRNVIVGLIILGLLGSIHFIGARKKYNA